MILLRNLRMELGEKSETLPKKAAKKLEIPQKDIEEFQLVKRSLDARKKKDIHYVCSVAMRLSRGEEKLLRQNIPAAVVAGQLNFESATYFTKVFKKYTGMTPSAYKKTVL